MRSFLLAVVVLVGVSLGLVPSAFARTDVGSRVVSESCGAAYMPTCVINFSLVPASTPGGPSANAPHIGGSVRWAVTESPVFSDGCSEVGVSGRITGANPGYTSQSPPGQTFYVGYSGARAGIDTVTFTVDIAGCNGWVYHTTLNGTAGGQVQSSVGWGMNLWDNGQCDSPSDTVFGGAAFRAAYQQQCVDDPVSGGLGAYESSVTDAVLPSPGVPFAFERSYTAGDTGSGPLGFGWHGNYDAKLFINTSVSPNTVTALMGTGQQILFTQQADGSWAGPAWATATLTYTSGTYSLRQAGHVGWTFSGTSGYLTGISRNGQTLAVSQAFYGPSTVTTSNGRAVIFYYDANYRISQMVLPGGRNVYYSYDAAGNLATVTDLRGGVTSYTYDSSHDLLTVVDPRGHTVVTNVYGDYGRLVSQTDALGNTTTYSLLAPYCGQICFLSYWTLTTTDPRGHGWTQQFSADGLLASTTDPLGNQALFGWDATTRDPLSYTDPGGSTVQYSYDGNHNQTGTALPGAVSSSSTFTTSNDLATSTDGRGNTTSYTYDTNGNPTVVTQPGGATIGLAYNSKGQLTGLTDQNGKTTSSGYDTPGNLTSVTSPLGSETSYGYDASGRVTSVVDPRGNVTGANPADYTTTYSYDSADEVTSVTDPLGHATSSTYDADGNLSTVTDANGHEWQNSYDADNRLTKVTAPDSTYTSYSYDTVGNLASRTDAKGHTTTYSYDAANRLTDVVDALSRHWVLGYDADSNLTSIQRPSGGTITYTYDALGQRTSTSFSDGTPTVSYSYDADGNRATMTDGAGTTSYTYNALDQLTQVSRGSNSFTYTYDIVGRIASRTSPDGVSTSYTYNDDGSLATAASGGHTTSYSYDAAGELTQTALPNGLNQTYSYDHAGQLTQLNDGFRTFAYGYDPAGNTSSRTINSVASSYSYDPLNRLTDVSGATTLHYAYDAVGNRTSAQDASGTTSYSYDAGDQLQSTTGPAGTTNYSYNGNGDQTGAGPWTYANNLAGRLTTASTATQSVAYTYDGDGNRLTATTAGATTNYQWDTNFGLPQLATETNTSGNSIRDYSYGLSRISLTTPTTTAYYSSDAIGTTTALSSSSGTLLGSYDSQPFGDNPTSTSVDPSVAGNPFSFAGEYQDPTSGLYNLRARNYDPTTSRLLTADPLGPQAQQGTYVYAGDNPLGQIDPSGLRHTPSCSLLCQIGGLSLQCAGNTACNTAFTVGTTLTGDPELELELQAEALTAEAQAEMLAAEEAGNQAALRDLVNEVTNAGRKPLSVEDANTVTKWGQEVKYPGLRADPADVASPSNWKANPVPHIHLPGAGRGGHLPVDPGVDAIP